MDPFVWGLIGLFVLLVIRGFFVAAHAALSSVRRQSLREESEAGDRSARLALSLAEDSSPMLNTFRMADLFADFLLAGLLVLVILPPAATWLAGVLRLQTWAATIITYLVVVPVAGLLVYFLTDVLPSATATQDPLAWSKRLAGPSRLTISVLRPFVALEQMIRQNITSANGGDGNHTGSVTEEEIMTLVDAGEEEGSIELEEKEMIYSIFQLDETLAREIMVPRIDIVALEMNTPLDEARRLIIEAGHSRIPVYEESLDHIRGMLYAKDLLEVWHAGGEGFDMQRLLRAALFIPESKRVSDLLHELQQAKVHIAVVIDEYGGTAGLVTIEDIVEEIVGEIFDEYDEAVDLPYETLGPDEYMFDARIDLDDFNRLLDVHLPTEMGDTLGGYIYGQLGKVPEVGETVDTGRLHIEVMEVVDRRIRKVRVTLLSQEEIPAASTEEGEPPTHANHTNGR